MASVSDLELALSRLLVLRERTAVLLTTRPDEDVELDLACRELARLQRELVVIVQGLAGCERQRDEALQRAEGAKRAVARLLAERRTAMSSSQLERQLVETQEALRRAEARAEQLARRAPPDQDEEVLFVIASDGDGPEAVAATVPVAAAPRRPVMGPEHIPAPLTWGQAAWWWCATDGPGRSLQCIGKPGQPAWPPGGEPADVLVLPAAQWAVWRSHDGIAHLGDPAGSARILGPVLGRPALMRGCGGLPVSVAWSDPAGAVRVLQPGGSCDLLTEGHGGPPAIGAAASWWWDYEGSRHVVYRDAEGGINEFLELDGVWYHAPLHQHTGCPSAAGDPVGYAPGDHEHVLFRSADGHIHELCFDGRSWRAHDLTAASGAPLASGQPTGAYVGGRHVVAFRDVDGHLNLLRLRKDWRCRTLHALGRIDGDPLLGSSGRMGALAWPASGGWRWCQFADEGSVEAASTLP
jgi:hypothetical protein